VAAFVVAASGVLVASVAVLLSADCDSSVGAGEQADKVISAVAQTASGKTKLNFLIASPLPCQKLLTAGVYTNEIGPQPARLPSGD
jgi:hypothetical protein